MLKNQKQDVFMSMALFAELGSLVEELEIARRIVKFLNRPNLTDPDRIGQYRDQALEMLDSIACGMMEKALTFHPYDREARVAMRKLYSRFVKTSFDILMSATFGTDADLDTWFFLMSFVNPVEEFFMGRRNTDMKLSFLTLHQLKKLDEKNRLNA